jgi:hexosaminidase
MLRQQFYFNKATAKKITLNTPPADKYPGDGAFTLVDGVHNRKGLSRAKEFLGYSGNDCEFLVSLGSFETIRSVTIHFFEQRSSWIWAPVSMEAFSSDDGQYFSSLGKTEITEMKTGGNGTMTVRGSNTGRFIKVVIKNFGKIPVDNPGAGNRAWLFIDEVEVN